MICPRITGFQETERKNNQALQSDVKPKVDSTEVQDADRKVSRECEQHDFVPYKLRRSEGKARKILLRRRGETVINSHHLCPGQEAWEEKMDQRGTTIQVQESDTNVASQETERSMPQKSLRQRANVG
ncbi:hypothetical protein WMY93_014130 [Mugilogobius chulae]|uniref:Uncharacterized protein n=1 Tax=Mugilogobius chulae TaxID=88201 RepID=A0AAW0P3L8_9GOBI